MSEGGQVPISGDLIPDGLLLARSDHEWEYQTSDIRIAMVQEWVAPLMERIQILSELGSDVETDDDFSALVDEMYEGVRNRLTRQDLVRALLLTVGKESMKRTKQAARQAKRQLNMLDRGDIGDLFGS